MRALWHSIKGLRLLSTWSVRLASPARLTCLDTSVFRELKSQMWRPTLLSTGGRWWFFFFFPVPTSLLVLSVLLSSLSFLNIVFISCLSTSLCYFSSSSFWAAAIQVVVSLSWKLLGSDRNRRKPAGQSGTWLSLSLPSHSWHFQHAQKLTTQHRKAVDFKERIHNLCMSLSVFFCLSLYLLLCLFMVFLFPSVFFCLSPPLSEVSLQVKLGKIFSKAYIIEQECLLSSLSDHQFLPEYFSQTGLFPFDSTLSCELVLRQPNHSSKAEGRSTSPTWIGTKGKVEDHQVIIEQSNLSKLRDQLWTLLERQGRTVQNMTH